MKGKSIQKVLPHTEVRKTLTFFMFWESGGAAYGVGDTV